MVRRESFAVSIGRHSGRVSDKHAVALQWSLLLTSNKVILSAPPTKGPVPDAPSALANLGSICVLMASNSSSALAAASSVPDASVAMNVNELTLLNHVSVSKLIVYLA